MINRKKIEQIAFKCRGAFWGAFALGVLLFPCDYEITRFLLGLFLVLIGQFLRFWAAGYIPEYRTETIGAPELITWGPYKWVRNPLYSSNFIMGLGLSLMLGYVWVVAFTCAFILLYVCIVIPGEEKFLASKFGEMYVSYKEKVPPLLPFPRKGFPDIRGIERPFDKKSSFSREIYSVFVNLIVLFLIFAKLYFRG
ncbi:MAG: isoprenylcysteine carboxylmethyltransferase family protein [Synergistaceae bacterium]